MIKVAKTVVVTSFLLTCAASAQDFCVPPAQGVPPYYEAPLWWLGTHDPNYGTANLAIPEDPRWEGAAGTTFTNGGAAAPFAVRALQTAPQAIFGVKPGGDPSSATTGTNVAMNYLMSFTSTIDTSNGAGTNPHDVFIGIRRPGSHPVGDVAAYMLQIHVADSAATGVTQPSPPAYCHDPLQNNCTSPSYYAVWEDQGNGLGSCGDGVLGETFRPSTTVTDLPWLDNVATIWELGATGGSVFTQNRWGVQVALPVLTTAGVTLDQGVEPGATIWYEAAENFAGGNTDMIELGQWPNTASTRAMCFQPGFAGNDFIVDVDLQGGSNYGFVLPTIPTTPAAACNATTPCAAGYTCNASNQCVADCEGGLELANVGTVHGWNGTDNLATIGLTTEVFASGSNTIVAQVTNVNSTSGAGSTIATPLTGRFRLAAWGTASLWTQPGKWIDVPGAAGGVCAGGIDAATGTCELESWAPGATVPIHFNWTIGADAFGESEFCKYGFTPVNGANTDHCAACSCGDGSAKCDATTDTGTAAFQGASGTAQLAPCVSAENPHECMEVELSVPAGSGSGSNVAVNFTKQSTWNNLEFAGLSTDARTALIDVRGLFAKAGQTEQDVYLLVMPRNMPATLPAGTTGQSLIASNALARAQTIVQPYSGSGAGGPVAGGERLEGNAGGGKLPGSAASTVAALVALSHASGTADTTTRLAVAALGDAQAANVLPTLEIYAYYKTSPRTWVPMTSFGVFLSHEGALGGIHYEIDGVTRVGPNIYHLTVPVNHVREIQIRTQALAPGDTVEAPGNPKWPCRGGCCAGSSQCGIVAGLGNTGPALAVGLVLAGRGVRRKKKQ